MNWNYPQNYYPTNQSYGSTVVRVQNDNSQPASLENSQRLSAAWLDEFFKDFDPDSMDLDMNKPENVSDFYEKPIFRNNENNKVFKEKQQKIFDKKEQQTISKNATQKRKRIPKFDVHFTRGKPCTDATRNLLRNRSQSKSPTPIPRSPTNTFSSNASSYENPYLNPPQPQYYSSQSPSLSPSPLSPSLSPSDFNNSPSSSYCTQSCCFSFNPENQQQQQSNYLYPQWNYDNDNNQFYPSDYTYYDQTS